MAVSIGRLVGTALLEALCIPNKNVLDVKVNMNRDEIVSATFTVALEPETFAKLAEILTKQQDEYKRAKAQA